MRGKKRKQRRRGRRQRRRGRRQRGRGEGTQEMRIIRQTNTTTHKKNTRNNHNNKQTLTKHFQFTNIKREQLVAPSHPKNIEINVTSL